MDWVGIGQVIGGALTAAAAVTPVLVKLRRDLGQSNGESLRDIVMEIRGHVKSLDQRVSRLEGTDNGAETDPPVLDE